MNLKKKTIIITGAGSNLGYGFLTGSDLRRFLCFKYRDYFLELFRGVSSEPNKTNVDGFANQIETFSQKFFDSHIKSIDYFLQLNPAHAEVGKIGIICALSMAESKSSFGENAPKAENNDWLTWLFNEFIASSLHFSDFENALSEIPLRFITFNYDRSIEYFLFTAISNSLPAKSIKERFIPNIDRYEFLNVRHMYGRLGRLPWQPEEPPRNTSEQYIKLMGQQPDYSSLDYRKIPRDHLNLYAQNINIIGERLQQDKTDIANLFQWADRIFFLGFGYAQENLDALNILENFRPGHDVYGTANGFIENEITSIQEKLARYRPNGDGKTIIQAETILKLLRMHLL